ncbi:hypothetical protein EC957_003353 [Mortierella hygrophila]|uniref:F-box domain-containing protein n=1 Tax=Mortierella hygrophila TaxID=979708 RepID=A0A9P6F222_9FUNG|nr:hypothetical protein EC957_003353 [Mortierella hygrophila]
MSSTTILLFSIPELISLISRFVTLKDAISCARVSKTWTNSFMFATWYEIDFDVHPRFAKLPPDIVSKNGHRIRIVKNARLLSQISVLANSRVSQLRKLGVETTATAMQNVLACEIIARNSSTLKELRLRSSPNPAKTTDSLAHYVFAPALAHFSDAAQRCATNLRVLQFRGLYLTHDSLMAILEASPLLSELALVDTDVVGTPTRSFTHTGVKKLALKLRCLFPVHPVGPSLLSYFPNLTMLSISSHKVSLDFPAAKAKDDITRYCPLLTGLHLSGRSYTIVSDFCSLVSRNLSLIFFEFDRFSTQSIMALLLHQATLKNIQGYSPANDLDYKAYEFPPVSTHLQESSRFLQLIPRGCPRLEILNLYPHEMDMDEVEMGEWVCKDLEVLHIRIKDLDTKDKMLRTIALWRAGCKERREEKAAGDVVMTGDETNISIEVRVARHLLKFKKLSSVWLGCQIWSPT